MSEITNLKAVHELLYKFHEETGTRPKKIHLTKYEIDCLNKEAHERVALIRQQDIKNCIRPDLLPPAMKHTDVMHGDRIYGVEIVESETGGHISTD